MKRWHEDSTAMKRQQKTWRKVNHYFYEDGSLDGSLGRFRKKHAMDCGKTGCYICHSDKLMEYKTKQQEIADMRMKEQIKDE